MKEVNKDKERLEEIEKRVLVDKVYYKYLDGTEGHWGKVYTLSEEDYNYLIERVQELEEELVKYRNSFELQLLINNNIKNQIKRYREALEKVAFKQFNVEPKRVVVKLQSIARQALEESE